MGPNIIEASPFERNLSLLRALRGINFLWFYLPTLVLFYLQCGLTVQDILILKAFLSVLIAILEIPTGFIADKVGRRLCLIWGSVTWIISIAIYLFGTSFSYFLLSDFFLAISLSLVSGADVAIAYDSHLELSRENEFAKYEQRLSALSGWSEAVGGILGGLVAAINIRLPFVLQLAVLFVFLALALQLKETTIHKAVPKPLSILEAVRLSLLQDKRIRSLIYFSAVSAAGTSLIVWFSQAHMELINVPVYLFGVCWAAFHVVMGISSSTLTQLEKRFGPGKIALFTTLLLPLSFLILGLWTSYWSLLAVFLLYAIRGVRTPFARIHLDNLISSDVRATILSVQSFAFRVIFAVVALGVGYVSKVYGLSAAFSLSSVIFLVLGVHAYVECLRHRPFKGS